jgi:uncharacterized MAPEG superfamily protein
MNFSILAIPIHYLLALLPHAYAIRLVRRALSGRWDNANAQGSAWRQALSAKLPAATLARFERAESAHRNGLENLPLFAAAVLAANGAGVQRATVDAHAAAWLVLRAVYNLLYVNIEGNRASFARTGVWVAGLGICASLFWKAAAVEE